MSNDSPNDDLQDRERDVSQSNGERPPGREPGDTARETMAWAVFGLLALYVTAHPIITIFVSAKFTPDPGIVGALGTVLVSLLVVRALGGQGGAV